jgi:hypothetical protein
MSRATEDLLATLHSDTATQISELMKHENPSVRLQAAGLAIRLLKDNGITAQLEASEGLKEIQAQMRSSLPSREELEGLMQLTPDA